MAVSTDLLPPTLNLETADEAMADLDMVSNQGRSQTVNHALCNGFGFGGVNAAQPRHKALKLKKKVGDLSKAA
jgi:3-oxoacyl-[acyl-carrier-protein] synthase II